MEHFDDSNWTFLFQEQADAVSLAITRNISVLIKKDTHDEVRDCTLYQVQQIRQGLDNRANHTSTAMPTVQM